MQPEMGEASDSGYLTSVAAALLGALLVAVSLGWILDMARFVGVTPFDEQVLAIAMGLALAMVCLTLPGTKSWTRQGLALVAAGLLLVLMGVVAQRYPQLMVLSALRPAWLTGLSAGVLAGLLFLVWRSVGMPIVLIVALFSLAALFGSALGIPETPWDRGAIYLVTDPNALLGLPLRVAVEIVIPYVLFGELLLVTGGSTYLTDLSLAVFGRFRGGSAKAAVGASAAFGTISGNAVSNVAGTGIVTIPLMKRTGMTPAVAGAVEAAASTGGQLLPPVMGAAAFVMADYLQVPYLDVAVAATLPAILYFAAILFQVDRIAARDDVGAIAWEDRPSLRKVAREGMHFVLPFLALFAVLALFQARPQMAALAAVGSLILVCAVIPYKGQRLTPLRLWHAVARTGLASGPLLLITAAAGLVIGLISMTGLGFSIAADAIAYSNGELFILLPLVAVIAIIFGMGMPTVAVYVVLATVLAPALVKAGLAPMQAHLFILYFGMLSMLTPPVALASITAARIAGAGMWKTSMEGVKLAWVAYIIPFLFALSPELLLGGTALGAVGAAVTAFLGTSAISIAAVGFARAPMTGAMRLVYGLLGAILLLPPSWGGWILLANIAAGAGFAALFILSGRKAPLIRTAA